MFTYRDNRSDNLSLPEIYSKFPSSSSAAKLFETPHPYSGYDSSTFQTFPPCLHNQLLTPSKFSVPRPKSSASHLNFHDGSIFANPTAPLSTLHRHRQNWETYGAFIQRDVPSCKDSERICCEAARLSDMSRTSPLGDGEVRDD